MSEEGSPDWYQFYTNYMDLAVEERDNRMYVDVQMTEKLVRGSPKLAQVCIQMLWKLYKESEDKEAPVPSAYKFHCCALYAAYIQCFGTDFFTEFLKRISPGLDQECEQVKQKTGIT